MSFLCQLCSRSYVLFFDSGFLNNNRVYNYNCFFLLLFHLVYPPTFVCIFAWCSGDIKTLLATWFGAWTLSGTLCPSIQIRAGREEGEECDYNIDCVEHVLGTIVSIPIVVPQRF